MGDWMDSYIEGKDAEEGYYTYDPPRRVSKPPLRPRNPVDTRSLMDLLSESAAK